MFTESDANQIQKRGSDIETVKQQIENFKNGFPYLNLERPGKIEDGIIKLSDDEVEAYITKYDQAIHDYEILKFVPASGAASRMFKALFSFMENYSGSKENYENLKSDDKYAPIVDFFKSIEKFAFYDDLKSIYMEKEGEAIEEALLKKEYKKILEYLLTGKGLNYGALPKGLLKFHKYEDGERTPFEEHLVEGAKYAKGKNNTANLHFTVSPEHNEKFSEIYLKVRARYENELNVKYDMSFSEQKPSTDTIAVGMDNNPFRSHDGTILFRPAGHGALLDNLNDQDADIIFIKNIDNVVPDRIKGDTIRFKKALAGILLNYQKTIHRYLNTLESGKYTENDVDDMWSFLNKNLGINALEGKDKSQRLKQLLDRPVRVCGMVKSDGDPGGGPFWVKNALGDISLQIVETAQIDLSDERQKEIFSGATHFNPVDLICGTKNHKGEKYNLLDFRDLNTGFITQKSKSGKDLKAQELPGLWNGSMANWNTVFVEVPSITFNPVKQVNDLLKENHQ
ncbi:MAG TPA: DUF4301 family protein [Cyclobacteriaceae bacterium]